MRILRYAALAVALVTPAVAAQTTAKKAPPAAQPIVVYKTATCGCCTKWVDHLKAAGFAPTVHTVQTMDEAPIRPRIPAPLRSCHTATLEGYLVEGHVPADVIRKLLSEKPRVEGIAVPGMPAGSPGMESSQPEPYDILAFDASGKTSVFAKK
jgi:hypothetical protein